MGRMKYPQGFKDVINFDAGTTDSVPETKEQRAQRLQRERARWRYAFFRFERHFPQGSLRVRWATAPTKKKAYAMEGRILLHYIKLHCELPPLNYKFNWDGFAEMKVFFETLGAD